MSTSKITLMPATPISHASGTLPIDKRTMEPVSASASAHKPVLISRQKVPMPLAGSFPVGSSARCKVSSLTPHGEKLNAETALVLHELLGVHPSSTGESGAVTREVLERAIASPLRAKDIRALPATPTELMSEAKVTAWTSRLVAACDHVYAERGMQAYIEAVTDLIFDEGNAEAGLPDSLRDFCAMLTKNALEAGIAQGLDRKALQGLRNTVIMRFLMGSVFVPHLRPSAMRESSNDTTLYNFDRQLFKRFADKTTEIIDIDAEAIALLAVSRLTKQQGDVQVTPVNGNTIK